MKRFCGKNIFFRLNKKSNLRLLRKPQMLGSVTATSLCGCTHYPLCGKRCDADDADGALSTV